MKILISGAGIAGLAAARELGGRGHEVTVVEYARGLRLEGTPVDIRGDAVGVMAEAGLLGRILERRLRMSEESWFVDGDGERIARIPLAASGHSGGSGGQGGSEASSGSNGPGGPGEQHGDIEILRADLVQLLAEELPSTVTVRFADAIRALTDHGDGVRVGFESGGTGHYDLVLGADGQHSAVRRLAFGPDRDCVRHLGVYFALAELPGEIWSGHANSLHSVPGALAGVFRYGDRTVAVFQLRSGPLDYDRHDQDARKRVLHDAFAGHRSWRIPRLLDAVRTAPALYLDAASQVRLPSWHRGRVALVGDAGYCPAFLSGRGTSLALTGARFLAEELASGDGDHTAAFVRYEARQRPSVTAAQAHAHRGRGHLLPATRAALDARNERLRSAAAGAR
ncbi:FAD-dependent monooxygenase [Streptomyces sp. NPDC003691]